MRSELHPSSGPRLTDFEKLRLPLLDPMRPGQALALWAVSVAAAIEGIAFIATLIATFMTRHCATDIDAPWCCR
jgi:hypothetical protein